MNTSLKIAAALGALSFFVLWGCVFWGLWTQDWPQVTAFAALLCAINTTWRAKR
jgi:hypothetical protein